MKSTSAAILLMALALPARAAITDSGNLTIGGQGVISGTFTVQGSAFSVGATTFSVNGSSVGIRTSVPAAALDVAGSVQIGSGTAKSTFTAAGMLKLNAAGIQWADGSTSTTAAVGGGGGGDAFLSANQTFTGSDTFASTVTVGPSVYSTTANYSSVLRGGCSVVVYSSFTAASTVYITGISSVAYKHVLTLNATKATVGTLKLTVNSDEGSNYRVMSRGFNSSGSLLSYSSTGNAYFPAVECYSGGSPDDGTKLESILTLINAPKLHNHVIFSGQGFYNYNADANTHDIGCQGLNGRYVGTAPMTSLTLKNSGGTITGWLTIEACVPTPAQ